MFFISALAETNRTPFDLPEAEAELVSGYNVEYSALGFAFFFIAEYANIMLMSIVCVNLFLGGWLPIYFFKIFPSVVWLILKFLILLYLFITLRAALPRYRYDQLMKLGWKCFLPISLGFVCLFSGILYAFEWFPLSYFFEMNRILF
jgi:NADH-quinone oxidoreductase subunit H